MVSSFWKAVWHFKKLNMQLVYGWAFLRETVPYVHTKSYKLVS